MKNKECYVCGKPAIKAYIPMLEKLPVEPQGYINFEVFGDKIFLCPKHRLKYQVVDILSKKLNDAKSRITHYLNREIETLQDAVEIDEDSYFNVGIETEKVPDLKQRVIRSKPTGWHTAKIILRYRVSK